MKAEITTSILIKKTQEEEIEQKKIEEGLVEESFIEEIGQKIERKKAKIARKKRVKLGQSGIEEI
jgi:hypothetical protein